MKRLSLVPFALAVALLIPAVAHAQGQSDIDAINRLIDRYGEFEDAMDMVGQASLISADRVWIAQGAGRRTNQAQNMVIQAAAFDAVKAQVPGIRFFTEDRDRLIKFHGNGTVAVVSLYRYRTFVLPPDTPSAVADAIAPIQPNALTMVLEKRGDEWKIVHTHFSSLGPPVAN